MVARRQFAASLVLLSLLCLPANASDNLPLTLTISGPQTVTAGNRIIVQPVVKNVSDHTIRGFWFRTDYVVTILNEDGLELIPGAKDWGGSTSLMPSLMPIDVSPGATRSDIPVRLDLMYNLVPGKYSVQFACHVDPNDSKSPMVKSNWITITVTRATEKPPLTLTIIGPQAAMAEDHIVIQPVLKNISDQKISS